VVDRKQYIKGGQAPKSFKIKFPPLKFIAHWGDSCLVALYLTVYINRSGSG